MQLKRFLAIFLAATLMFSALSLTGSAETTETVEILKVGVEAMPATPVSISPIIANKGEEVSVRVTISQNTGITFLRFVIYFDSNALDFISCESYNLISAGETVTVKDGYLIYFVNLDDKISTITGELLEIKFNTKTDFCGETRIYSELVQGRPANCAKFSESSTNTYVSFEAQDVTLLVHNINACDGIVTDPKCLENGYTSYCCHDCEEIIVGNIVSALGHSAPATPIIENIITPSCLEDGSFDNVIYCEICNAELERVTETIEKLGHDYSENVTDPTCTESGCTTHTCVRCGDSYVDNCVDALGHDLVHHEAKEATCTEIGWEAYDTCSRCDYTTYIEIPALGHDYSEDVTDPTCTESGCTTHTCVRCGDSYIDNCVDALGHTYGESTVIAPEYGKEGYTVHTCTVCGHEEKYDIVPALTYIIGDIDGDGKISARDYQLLKRAVLKTYNLDERQKLAGDIDGDGKISARDYQLLKRAVLGTYVIVK